MNKFIFGIFFYLMSASFGKAQVGRFQLGVRALNKKNYGIAQTLFKQVNRNNPSLGAFGKSILYSETKEFYNLDSSLFYLQIALGGFEENQLDLTQSQRKKLKDFGWDLKNIIRRYDSITSERYAEIAVTEDYKTISKFIERYPTFKEKNEAIKLRDSLWFNACDQSDLFCLIGLIRTSPNSHLIEKISAAIESKAFKEWTGSNSEQELTTFMQYHPQSKYITLAEDEIYRIFLRQNDTIAFKEFLIKYPKNRNRNNIWKVYFQKAIGDQNLELMASFIAVHPEFPFRNQVLQEIDKFKKNLFPVANASDLFGYMDEEGNLMINYAYEEANDFHEGLASVKRNGKYGVIIANGNKVVDFTYEFISDFNNGQAICRNKGEYGIIDRKGLEIVPCMYEDLQLIFGNYYCFKSNGAFGVLNDRGELVLKPEYSELNAISDNIAEIVTNQGQGLLNNNLEIVLPPNYEEIIPFQQGFIVKKGGKYGIVDFVGKIVIPFQYDGIFPSKYTSLFLVLGNKFSHLNTLNWEISTPWSDVYSGWRELAHFNGVEYITTRKGQYFWTDTLGKTLKQLKINFLNSVGNVLSGKLNKESKLGLFDRLGNAISTQDYDEIQEFKNGFLKVTKESKFGLFSEEGQKIVETIYDEIVYLSEVKLFILENNGKKGICDLRGNIIIPLEYNAIYVYGKDKLLLKLDSRMLYYNFITKKSFKLK